MSFDVTHSYQSGSFIYKIPQTFLGNDHYIQRFLATVYNHRIEKPADVLPYIDWSGEDTADHLSAALYGLFIMCFIRWMSGTGHPSIMLEDGQISSDVYEPGRGDQGLRVRLFHQMVTGSSVRLMGYGNDDVVIKVCN
jgi:hypothetical protein